MSAIRRARVSDWIHDVPTGSFELRGSPDAASLSAKAPASSGFPRDRMESVKLVFQNNSLRKILLAAFAASTARATLDVIVPLYAKNGEFLYFIKYFLGR